MAVKSDLITVGALREVVNFQTNAPTSSDSGGELDSWSSLLNTRGKLRKKRGDRALQAGQEVYNSGYELITRYQAILETALLAGQSLKMLTLGKTYIITSWEVYDKRFRYFVFQLNEQQAG